MTNDDLVNAYLEKNYITLVGTFSRVVMVEPWFAALDAMKLPRDKINLLIFNNSEAPELHKALTHAVSVRENKTRQYKEGCFHSCIYHLSPRRGGTTILGQDNDNFDKSKLRPIWEMWKELKELIKDKVFFYIEDDTIAPPNAFYEIVGQLLSREDAGFVTGIETGRALFSWQKVRLGVHYLTRDKNRIIRRVSLAPEIQGVVPIDAAGVYCFACYTDVYRRAFEGMNDYVADIPFFGMDNILTNNIKLQGKNLYADFLVWCDHLQASGGKLVAFNKTQAVQQADVWMPEYNNYAQGIEIKK
jgi:hypothetical protein